MYIRTREGLGQGQATWPTLETFNRPTAQPVPIGYLGNFNGRLGKAESEPCKLIIAVGEFGKGSYTLSDSQKKHIKDIAIYILRLLNRDLKGKSSAGVTLKLSYEGHVDAKTDPKEYGKLDEKRAFMVSHELGDQIGKLWQEFAPELERTKGHYFHTASRAGSTRPREGATPKQNRRVVVCARWKF